MNKNFLLVLFCLFSFLLTDVVEVQAERRKKKGKDECVEQKKESKYDQLFEGKKYVTREGMITLHKFEDKVYFEFPLTLLKREFLLGSTVVEISDNGNAIIGQKPTDPLHIAFQKRDKKIELVQISLPSVLQVYSDTDQESYNRAIRNSNIPPVLKAMEIMAYNADSTAVVFDMTWLFLADDARLTPFDPYSRSIGYGKLKRRATFNREVSYIDDIKAFEDNIAVISSLSYDQSLMSPVTGKSVKTAVTVKMNRSMILLPEKDLMRGRLADPRVGLFYSVKENMTTETDGSRYTFLMNRWRMEPEDMEAYKRGELVEPVKPIVFYVDNGFPEDWKAAVHAGIREWNKAFEEIGLKNVMVSRDFPTDDPEFDPDNLKYSCIRYAPISIANGMGPSWTDPRTGEIINASVYIYHDVIRLINDMRFVQTAQVDERVRTVKQPDDVLYESMRYIVAHEVGHCLGLMHNMASSFSIPVDSLRSATFTAKYGTTPSIMDYARYNYVAQPGDKGVRLTPPELGVYDYYAIKVNYQPVPDATTMKEENKVVQDWIAEKAGDPMYRYGKQQIRGVYDPSALTEDLGDDAVKAGDYGMANLKYILNHLNEWMQPRDKDYSYRMHIYDEIVYQCRGYLYNAYMNVGGVYLTERFVGDPMPSFQVVPKDIQKRNFLFLLKHLKNLEWLDDFSYTGNLHVGAPKSQDVINFFAGALLNTKRVSLCAYREPDAYTPKEYLDDLYAGVWESTLKGRKPKQSERYLQQVVLNGLFARLAPAYKAESERQSREPMFAGERICMSGERCRHMEDVAGFGLHYGVYNVAHDNSQHLYYLLLQRVENLLRQKVGTADRETNLHYSYLLEMIEDFRNAR
ncbi:zinc-dependent metalloprotease [Butyricimonas sp.]|uniref:zinc-dependent metalloprotease n=1 Tax=Butyricimonas sp. TaxID=1969738 RepID=UPI0025BA6D82|nr:zinc-dependent metalloprotease [Butyricimonas sp.]